MSGNRRPLRRPASCAGAVLTASLVPAAALADGTLDDVFLHVVAHEMGHAMIREFDLPVTASEEAMADAFAVVALQFEFPDRVADIVADRAAAHLADDDPVGPFDEYPSDARRAGAIVCLAFALDPEGHAALARRFGLEGDAARACSDFGSEIARGWRRTVAPYRMPEGMPSTEVRFREGEGMIAGGRPSDDAVADAMTMLTGIDWHSTVTLALDHCDDGAGWSRGERTILICDAYMTDVAAEARAGSGSD